MGRAPGTVGIVKKSWQLGSAKAAEEIPLSATTPTANDVTQEFQRMDIHRFRPR
jgi:hypothetical protein